MHQLDRQRWSEIRMEDLQEDPLAVHCTKKTRHPVTFWYNFTNPALISVIISIENLHLFLIKLPLCIKTKFVAGYQLRPLP